MLQSIDCTDHLILVLIPAYHLERLIAPVDRFRVLFRDEMIAFARNLFLHTCIARVISRGGCARLEKNRCSPFRPPSSYLAFDDRIVGEYRA